MAPKFFHTTSKTKHKLSPRFFQTISKTRQDISEILSSYSENKTKRIPEIIQIISKTRSTEGLRDSSNYDKNKIHKRSLRFFQTMCFKNKTSYSRHFSSNFKNKTKRIPGILQITSKTKSAEGSEILSNEVVEKQDKIFPRFFQATPKIK